MLILWRRPGESLLVGKDVEIQVLDAKPNRVKLGIVAPAEITVVRKEAQATREQNLAAATSSDEKTLESLVRLTRRPAAGRSVSGRSRTTSNT